jgi:hypothetical protein
MFAANAYHIRPAGPADARVLTVLAGLDSQRPLAGPVLIGEIAGTPVAAIGTDDGRVIADPFRSTAAIAAHLRMRASGYRAVKRQPSLRERILTSLRPALAAS